MTTAETSVAIILVLVGVGAFFGIVLALADKKFYMQQNPLIDEVEDIRPNPAPRRRGGRSASRPTGRPTRIPRTASR